MTTDPATTSGSPSAVRLHPAALDDPDVAELVVALQQVYLERYGGADATPTDPGEFAPPNGYFLLVRNGSEALGCGGWRARDDAAPGLRPGDAEIKRMYVVPSARGRGLARAMLAELERTAVAAGRRRMVLETGTRQPEAIALYASSGYLPIPAFGAYRCEPDSRCYAKTVVGRTLRTW